MKKIYAFLTLAIVLLIFSATTYANFYVIAAGKSAKRTILVSPKATETASGQALLDALAKITDASETNPYLIILEPGIYDVGANQVVTKSWVTIQGAGEKSTLIKGNVAGSEYSVIKMVSYAELRFLTIRNYGGGTIVGVRNDGNQTRLIYVTVECTGAAIFSYGIKNAAGSLIMDNVIVRAKNAMDNTGILNGNPDYGVIQSASLTAQKLTVEAVAGTAVTDGKTRGIHNKNGVVLLYGGTVKALGQKESSTDSESTGIRNDSSGKLQVNNFKITASASELNTGVANYSSNCRIYGNEIGGANFSVRTGSNDTTYIANTQLNSGIYNVSGGQTICACVWDRSLTFYANTCP